MQVVPWKSGRIENVNILYQFTCHNLKLPKWEELKNEILKLEANINAIAEALKNQKADINKNFGDIKATDKDLKKSLANIIKQLDALNSIVEFLNK